MKVKRVYIVGGGWAYSKMFLQAGFLTVDRAEEADMLCFTGGADVNPELYGEKAIPGTHSDYNRDRMEMDIFNKYPLVPKVGICRGGQFLNVMNGGKLWQDVNNHTRDHHIHTVSLDGKGLEQQIQVSSTHHQMMRPAKHGLLLAFGCDATIYNGVEFPRDEYPEDNLDGDAEVVWYEETKSLCFQPHPEFTGYPECTNYFFHLIEELF
jgi:carbamoylphosphate synthase small subunit